MQRPTPKKPPIIDVSVNTKDGSSPIIYRLWAPEESDNGWICYCSSSAFNNGTEVILPSDSPIISLRMALTFIRGLIDSNIEILETDADAPPSLGFPYIISTGIPSSKIRDIEEKMKDLVDNEFLVATNNSTQRTGSKEPQ